MRGPTLVSSRGGGWRIKLIMGVILIMLVVSIGSIMEAQGMERGQFQWCATGSQEKVLARWDFPAVITGDGSFSVNFASGSLKCEDVTSLTLDLNRPVPVPKQIVYNEEFWSEGYFRYGKHYYHRKEFCISELNQSSVNVSFCTEPKCGPKNPCIPKCCALNKLVTTSRLPDGKRMSSCRQAHGGSNSFRPILYSQPFRPFKTENEYHFERNPIQCSQTALQILPHVTNKFAIEMYEFHGLCYRVKPDGTLMYRDMNYNWIVIPATSYCLDGFQYGTEDPIFSGGEEDYGVLMCGLPSSNNTKSSNVYSAIYGTALVSSSMFLLSTFIVYAMLWNQHSVHGWTTLCHSSSMFFMYLFLGIVHLSRLSPDETLMKNEAQRMCELIGVLSHFFFICSFCWFTVINFDLFWTFRGISFRGTGSKGAKRFIFYATFAYGLPTAIVVTSIVLDYMYRSKPCNMFPVPAYGMLRKCYIDSAAMGPYMYYPVGCLLVMDLMFFVITSYKLYEYKKSTRMATQNMNNKQQLFTLIAKLFFVMGFTWIFEFVSWYHSGDEMKWYWVIVDVINCGQAVAIFVVYVCKPDILRSLITAYPVLKPYLAPLAHCLRLSPAGPESANSGTYATSAGTSVRSKNQTLTGTRKDSVKT